MKIIKKNLVILHIQNNKTNWIPITRQTQNIREQTNIKIKELGDKYFHVKSLFEQMNFHRDNLFFFGKQIEEKMKNDKIINHLMSQNKRMKEALYCWYAENFYKEIFEPNSVFIKNLIEFDRSQVKTINKMDNSKGDDEVIASHTK